MFVNVISAGQSWSQSVVVVLVAAGVVYYIYIKSILKGVDIWQRC